MEESFGVMTNDGMGVEMGIFETVGFMDGCIFF